MDATELDILKCLSAAAAFGVILGINRQLHRKPGGWRTHSLVCVGAAMATWLMGHLTHGDANAISRVVQGIVTGVGFIGAGVIMHRDSNAKVEGLTTAASIWMAAMMGIGCGVGLAPEAGIGFAVVMLLLVVGSRLEPAIARFFHWPLSSEDGDPPMPAKRMSREKA